MKKYLPLILTILVLFPLLISAQKKEISLEDIFTNQVFGAKRISSVNWMKNGKFYTAKVGQQIVKFNSNTGEEIEVLFDGNREELSFNSYKLSNDEQKLLILTDRQSIYRRSYTAEYFIYDLTSKQLKPLSRNGRQQYATFSPDASKVAFTRDNNVFYVDLDKGEEIQVTTDGKWNHIINGSTDWVYEEEFGFVKGFQWSPNSDKIAYYKFDESNVKEYNMQVWDSLYPSDYRYKYPKAGEENSKISIHIFHIKGKRTVEANLSGAVDFYIPRMQWTQNNDILSLIRMNRFQNRYEILHIGSNSGMSQIELLEGYTNNYFDLDYCDDLTYLENGEQFIYSSEQKGYKHLFLYNFKTKKMQEITKGKWEMASLEGIDEKSKTIYFTSTEDSPMERQFYKIGFNGKGKKKLSSGEGWHSINMSDDYKYYIDTYSKPGLPASYTLYDVTGKVINVMEDNTELKKTIQDMTGIKRNSQV